jgi:hypothetical protein
MSRKGNNKGQPANDTMQKRETRPAESQPNRIAPSHESPIDPARQKGNGNHASDQAGDGQVFKNDQIAERAYQIFEREGRMDGRDMDHWLQAERELRTERERRSPMNAQNMTAQNSPRSARQHQQSAS